MRAHAELGHDEEYAATLARLSEVSRQSPDEGMHALADIIDATVELQRGNPEAVQRLLGHVDRSDPNDLGAADEASAIGLMRLQLGDVDGAIAALERPYLAAATTVRARRSVAASRWPTRPRIAPRTRTTCSTTCAPAKAAPTPTG